jgi:hypothetical protein
MMITVVRSWSSRAPGPDRPPAAALAVDALASARRRTKRSWTCRIYTHFHVEIQIRRPAVYNDAMGLFRRRAKKDRGKMAAEPLEEQSRTAKTQTDVTPRVATAEARPNPDQPGWGETIGQQIGKARDERASQE